MSESNLQKATLGGGCFWCLEAVYQQVRGVVHVESGYTGGQTLNPDYDSVCTGKTGHAEVVQIEFDAGVISYRTILDIFFAIHDPTTLNRQGNDVGSQYRSVIYAHDSQQRTIAQEVIQQLTKDNIFDQPIVTELADLPTYYKAEEYHQNYFNDHPDQGYCAFVVSPKVSKFRKQFAALLN
ncbi:peptide-methionine (S)-S-oxide reductase MsrA [Polynucleobacter victoriensis]|uniref:Peptide methionine sulfoxide reductase MsrA n=1 Tax=Polynucleobacter victoriensis TaxID=2049319 RepID=A0A212T5M1_9BURK|nr:peptide-methionine (S)-S-oxide reductase MsrA [Polynucleobacter victoriensis]SNC61338.1 peptide-methionine (S)-S-oxide reductase [Polynucleobacter victoriensis]